MVQVDVFWSYALGASMACAAQHHLEIEEKPSQSSYFVKNLLYLSTLFAPSGIYLLWNFPGWETMFVFDKSMAAWLVTLFAITNVTQGILGFYVCYWLIRRGKIYAANLQWIGGYFIMFFILIHGWDGSGYQRFFYGGTIEQWRAGVDFHVYQFIYSDVALTLYGMGLILLPVLFWIISRWLMDGYKLAGVDANHTSHGQIIKRVLFIIFVQTIPSIIVYSLLIRWFGAWIGALTFWPLFIILMLRRGGLIHRQVAALTLDPRVDG